MIDISAIRNEFRELSDIAPLADSGQKLVLRARQGADSVVLKLIKDATGARIDREIAAVAKLNSSYVPRLLEHGKRRIDGHVQYYVIESFVPGETYRSRLHRAPVRSIGDVLRLGRVLLKACADFEAQQLVHRDLKPENIIVDPDEKYWVLDFGIVRFLDMDSLTRTGQRFGPCTPGYGAPEQIRNQKSQINVRADLFSVGVILYESLNGNNPYLVGKRDPLAVFRHMESLDLPRLTIPGDIHGEFSELVAALTSRFPSRRPQTASDAVQWFRTVRDKIVKGK